MMHRHEGKIVLCVMFLLTAVFIFTARMAT